MNELSAILATGARLRHDGETFEVVESVELVLGTEQHTPERLVRLLADDFQVSEAAMGYRLINLGITT